MGRFPTYVVTMLALDLLGVSLAAGLFPPDAITQTYALGVILLVAPLLSYWLVYRDGFAAVRLGGLFDRGDNDDRDAPSDREGK